MKTPRIAEALHDLDSDLIAAAEAYSPSKPKSTGMRTAGIAACFCVLLLFAVFCFDKIKLKSNTTDFCIRAEVIEVTDSGQYQLKVLEEGDHFAKGSIVTIRAASEKEAQDGEGGNIVTIKSEFQYKRRNAVYEVLQPGDVIEVRYTDYVNQDGVSAITPENIEMIRSATEGAEKQ